MNNKCVDVPGGRIAQGAELIMWDCHGGANQRFEFTAAGELKIGGLCVDAFGGSGRNGDPIGLWSCHGGANQKWRVEGNSIKGMNNRCIDIAGGNAGNGAKLVLWDCHGGANQAWRVSGAPAARPAPAPAPSPTPQPAPAPGPTAQRDTSCDQGLYVIDGTSSEFGSQNLMVHFYRWAQPSGTGCRLVKRYYAGIGLIQGEGVDDLHRDAMTTICQDVAGRSSETRQGELWRVRSIGIIGYSRGAIVALNLANNLQRQGCPEGAFKTPIKFLGLVDAVRTSMPMWQGDLTASVNEAVHVHKKQEWSIGVNAALWTHLVGNIRSVTMDTTDHGTMNCARQSAASNATERELVSTAGRVGFKFPDRTFFGACGAPNHDAWKAPASSRYRTEVMIGR